MQPKIVAFLNAESQVETARAMAPQGFELAIFTRRDAPEARAAIEDADYLIGTVPPFDMDDAFYRACPRLKLVQLLIAQTRQKNDTLSDMHPSHSRSLIVSSCSSSTCGMLLWYMFRSFSRNFSFLSRVA